jgi:hypothetical protein
VLDSEAVCEDEGVPLCVLVCVLVREAVWEDEGVPLCVLVLDVVCEEVAEADRLGVLVRDWLAVPDGVR